MAGVLGRFFEWLNRPDARRRRDSRATDSADSFVPYSGSSDYSSGPVEGQPDSPPAFDAAFGGGESGGGGASADFDGDSGGGDSGGGDSGGGDGGGGGD